jgi:site-specific DNA-methyltransferase (adenine-specific)
MKFELHLGDCLELMKALPDNSVDLILCDLPYGTTACAWDSVIPLAPLWAEYKRIAKPNAAIVLTAAQPFTTALIASNMRAFKYEWIYEKTNPKGFLSAKRRPLTAHENVCVFSYGTPPYSPQKWTIPDHLRTKRKHATSKTSGECYGSRELKRWDDDGSRFPTSVIGFSNRVGRNENYHPTQKPIALMEYLVRTYTNEGDVVLDNCMGSGTTGVACMNTGRRFVGMEMNAEYFAIAQQRILAAVPQAANDNNPTTQEEKAA